MPANILIINIETSIVRGISGIAKNLNLNIIQIKMSEYIKGRRICIAKIILLENV
jgi:hypothetical protein